ncbi:aryl-hydrocarbon-interacting protein-like 1 [Rhineura floridana]|uniref:aryl-hydrocarbon-interacting protein-like 1 n=1 Tax=Rhineura floridana TaxID=261503 RepID=UPI002AC85BB3|nr:aryl-hydrocarbon-interacting protein-like 1 [Rhineura floridana]
MEETYLLNMKGVKKKILHGGYGELPDFKDGSKVTFHFQTLKDNFERTVIDDSREAGIPMEIIVGKMFKIEVWETLLTSMRIGEVAEFWCDAVHTGMYALVSKAMRKIAEDKDPLEGQKHCCGMGNMFDYHSTGYTDLDELQRTPQPLIFIMELFKVEDPSSYKRDTWAMNNEEQLSAVPKLHTEGNCLVLSRKFKEAAEKYQEAVICLCNVQAKEKPWDEDWLKLENLITPLVLNYCQCQLELGEYYEVLEHTTDLLQKNNENVKAYFKRAKAHAAIWNDQEARTDFLRAAQLDPSLAATVRKELKLLGERIRRKHVEDRKRYQDLFQQPPPKGETEGKSAEETEELSDPGLGPQMEEKNRETQKPERRGAEEGTGTGHTEQGNLAEEKDGLLMKMDGEDAAPQKVREEETGKDEREGQGEGKMHSHSGDDVTGCETSGSKHQLGFGQQKLQKERGSVEEMNAGPWEGFATLKEEAVERRDISRSSGKGGGGVAGNCVGEGSVEGDCEAEGSLRAENPTREREEYEASCGGKETKTGEQLRVPGDMDFGAENSKKGARVASPEGRREGDCFQVWQEGSKREAKGTTELNFRGKASSYWESSGGPRNENSVGEEEVPGEETELGKERGEADDHSMPGVATGCYEPGPGHFEGETDPEDGETATGDRRIGRSDDSAEEVISLGAKHVREEKDGYREAAGCRKEGRNESWLQI